jgi:hypothetical protein
MNQRITEAERLRAIELVRRIYARHMAGCCMHIVTDDDNLEDSSVQFCLDCARENNCAECVELATLMLKMKRTQRFKISKSHWDKR